MLDSAPVLTAAAIACFFASLLGCELVRRVAIRRALFDAPNERSLHSVPTPRLGGVPIVVVSLVFAALLWPRSSPEMHVLVGAAGLIALVGLRDDVKPLPAAPRFVLQIAASATFLAVIGTPSLLVARGVALPLPTAVTSVLLVVWMVGVLNIYNFMDGMDGLAGFQTLGAAVAFAVLLGGDGSAAAFAVAIASAAGGFLAHNFPPARMFMGDAGATFLGLAFAALGVVGLRRGVPLTESALALAPFLLDGTFTIVRRALRKEAIWRAHRTHLYQRAVQTGLPHREVLLVYIAWLAVTTAGAVIAPLGATALVVAWVAALLGLVLVWRWVLRREATAASDRAQVS